MFTLTRRIVQPAAVFKSGQLSVTFSTILDDILDFHDGFVVQLASLLVLIRCEELVASLLDFLDLLVLSSSRAALTLSSSANLPKKLYLGCSLLVKTEFLRMKEEGSAD